MSIFSDGSAPPSPEREWRRVPMVALPVGAGKSEGARTGFPAPPPGRVIEVRGGEVPQGVSPAVTSIVLAGFDLWRGRRCGLGGRAQWREKRQW